MDNTDDVEVSRSDAAAAAATCGQETKRAARLKTPAKIGVFRSGGVAFRWAIKSVSG